MKVLLVNGSPHKQGCTNVALQEVEKTLNANDIQTEIFQVGNRPVSGCIACGKCAETGKCCIDDVVNDFIDIVNQYDGFVFGSPVHYAAASGSLTSFMDRAFYGRSHLFSLKPAAAVVSCRRGGASAAFDQINKYFTMNNMPVVTSQYWNMVHGNTPEEVKKDAEGLQTMRMLGTNMAWLLKCIDSGRKTGVPFPEQEARIKTNFIR